MHSDGPCLVIHTPSQEHGYTPLGIALVFPSPLYTLGSATVPCQLHTLTDLRLSDKIHMAKSDNLEQPWSEHCTGGTPGSYSNSAYSSVPTASNG